MLLMLVRQFLASWLLICVVSLPFVPPVLAQDEAPTPQQTALQDLRAAIAGRDLPGMKVKLEAAQKLKGESAYDNELQRVEHLSNYVTQFWQSVDRVGKTMQATTIREITIGDVVAAFVEYENGTLVIRVNGQNRTYTLQNMPLKVALAVSQQELKPDVANNKVYFGAVLAMDAKGDRKLARQMWDEALAAKVDVKYLLPELDLEPPPPAVTIPQLTPLAKTQLQPKNWSLRVKGPRNWQKKPLGDTASQNDGGKLVFTAPADAGDVQLVFNRQLPPNFGLRVYFEGVKKGQTVGMFAASGDEDSLATELPGGTVVFELARQNGQLKSRVHGKEIELEASGKATSRTPSLLGITVPAGGQLTVSAIEIGVP
jgi:hypothetical protein